MIDIEVDQRSIRRVYDKLWFTSGKNLMGAMALALEDTTKEAMPLFVDELDAAVNTTRDELSQRVGSTEPVARDRFRIQAIVYVTKRPIPLKRFGPVQTSSGVIVKPFASRPAKVFRSGFGPNIPRLGRNVFVREGRKRLPIKIMKGVVLKDHDVTAEAAASARTAVRAAFSRNMKRRLNELAAVQAGQRGNVGNWRGRQQIRSIRDLKVGNHIRSGAAG